MHPVSVFISKASIPLWIFFRTQFYSPLPCVASLILSFSPFASYQASASLISFSLSLSSLTRVQSCLHVQFHCNLSPILSPFPILTLWLPFPVFLSSLSQFFLCTLASHQICLFLNNNLFTLGSVVSSLIWAVLVSLPPLPIFLSDLNSFYQPLASCHPPAIPRSYTLQPLLPIIPCHIFEEGNLWSLLHNAGFPLEKTFWQ